MLKHFGCWSKQKVGKYLKLFTYGDE